MDDYTGFSSLVEARTDASLRPAFCWAHARRPFYEFYTSNQSPLAAEVRARIAQLYEIEAGIRGHPPDACQAVRQLRSRPIVEALQLWVQDHLPRVPGWSDLAKATLCIATLGRADPVSRRRTPGDGHLCRRAGNQTADHYWAIANTLIQTRKLNNVDPLAYLTDVLQRIVSERTKNHKLHALLPWNWRPTSTTAAAA